MTTPFINVNQLGALQSTDVPVDASNPMPVSSTSGQGSMTAVPAGSVNGTALGVPPTGAVGARIYLASGDSVTFTIASAAPGSAPSLTYTVTLSTTGPNWDESLSGGQMMYITAKSGSPIFRWY